MFTMLRFRSLRCVIVGVILLLAGMVMPTQAEAALPSSVASRVARINTVLNAAEKALDDDHLTTAQRKLDEANKILKEIHGRYAGKFDEADPVYKAMTDHLAAATTKVESAASAAAGAAEAGKQAEAANEALCEEWIGKLGPFIDRKSENYLRIGSDLNAASPEDQAMSKAAYPRAKSLFEQYQKVEFPLGKSMEMKNVELRLVGALEEYGNEEASAAQDAACQPWIDRLAPFVDGGMGSPKYLIASPTASAQQIAEQQAIFEEATLAFAEYQKAEFPLGKSWRLETLEEAMASRLQEFPKAMAESQAMMSGDVGKRLDQMLAFMTRNAAWKEDVTKKPPVVMERDLAPLREAVDAYAETVGTDDTKLAELRATLTTIETTNAEHRAIRADRTFQRPDGYTGSDLKELKSKAESVALAAYPKSKALHVTVPSRDWAIEDVVEYTDTTNSALRHRTTRSVRAEVAIKDADGKIWLQEIYLAQDKLPDAGWSALKGHTTWADPMSPKNVGKLQVAPEA